MRTLSDAATPTMPLACIKLSIHNAPGPPDDDLHHLPWLLAHRAAHLLIAMLYRTAPHPPNCFLVPFPETPALNIHCNTGVIRRMHCVAHSQTLDRTYLCLPEVQLNHCLNFYYMAA